MTIFTPYCSIKKMLLLFCLPFVFSIVHAQVPVTAGGIGQTNADPNNAANGGAATGLGCGGGGANYYGGNGGDGMFGGGGGGAAGFYVANMTGGAGGKGVLVLAYYSGATLINTTVYQNGSSLTIPATITNVKVWAIGAGGGGAGSTDNDGTSGGGAGAGGIAYISQPVSTGDIINYSLGAGGAGGIDANNGSNGGNTVATINAITITGFGGMGGQYNNSIDAAGGSYSGGDGGSNGGDGRGIAGDSGGGGGGGIGAVIGGAVPGGNGADGANAADVSGLFSVLSSGTLLPVGWKVFYASNQDNGVLLQWETSYEISTLNFTVQYSTDAIHYNNAGVLPAVNNGSGNKYHFMHQKALPGTGYYRLLQTDINGRYSYSNVIKNILPSANDKAVILYSNIITDGNIKIQASKNTSISLLSFEGKLVSVNAVSKGVNNINVSNLSKGYYIVRSLNESQKILIR
jgi:hypothetical protein